METAIIRWANGTTSTKNFCTAEELINYCAMALGMGAQVSVRVNGEWTWSR